jgi:hypothetical protein
MVSIAVPVVAPAARSAETAVMPLDVYVGALGVRLPEADQPTEQIPAAAP